MRKIDEFNFFRELFFALKRDGVEEYNIMELGEQLYPYFAFGDYGKMFKVKTNDLFKRVDVSSISEIFIDSTRELRLNNNGMYSLCSMTVEKSPIKEEQAIIIQKLADILVKFKILEQKYNVKFSGCTPNLVYSLIGGTGKYMDISQMLVTDTDKIKTTIDEINPYMLYDSPVDGSLCRLEKGVTRSIKLLENVNYVIIHSMTKLHKDEYVTTKIYTGCEDKESLDKIVAIGEETKKDFVEDINEYHYTKPKILTKKLK